MFCKQCSSPINVNNKFCNRSCAAIYNNKMFPKRQAKGQCAICGVKIPNRLKYCSKQCRNLNLNKNITVFEKQCAKEKCGKTFQTSFAHQKFCCASCANSDNQRRVRSRRPVQLCPDCNEPMFYGSKKCSKCSINSKFGISVIEKLTLEELQNMAKYQANARVRNHARRVYASQSPSKSCEVCPYDKHIEVCHIKPISSFPGNTLISVINQRKNLIGLCCNCHWELDNGLLSLVPPGGIEPQALPSA